MNPLARRLDRPQPRLIILGAVPKEADAVTGDQLGACGSGKCLVGEIQGF
jgi:hypothetical protein